jgi:hypothetical protein
VVVNISIVGNQSNLQLLPDLFNFFSDDKRLFMNQPFVDSGVIIDAAKGFIADDFELQQGDLMIIVDRKKIQNMTELTEFIKSTPKILALNIVRDNRKLYLTSNYPAQKKATYCLQINHKQRKQKLIDSKSYFIKKNSVKCTNQIRILINTFYLYFKSCN